MITKFIVLIFFVFTIKTEYLRKSSLELRDQVVKNTENINKLDQTQYKFINQLTKLQDDINDLEEKIEKYKTSINKIQNIVERYSPLNKDKTINIFQKRVGRSSFNNNYNNNEINDVFFISDIEGFIWKLKRVSSFWNKTGSQYISKAFYSDGSYGYKIRLKLDNPFGKVRVMLEILKGEFDNLLPWPFNNEVEVSLLTQEYPYKHYTMKKLIKPDTCLNRAIDSIKQYSHIYSISLKRLLYLEEQNKTDSLIIECKFNNGTDLGDNKVFNRNIVWKIDKFYLKMKLKDHKVMNYSFYTGDFGYKLTITLYPNGVSDNGELNLFLTVLKGNNDDFLWWPFKYNVTVNILNINNTTDMCSNDIVGINSKNSESILAGFIFFDKSEIIRSYPSIIKNNQMFIKFKTKPLSYIFDTNIDEQQSEYKDVILKIENFKNLRKHIQPIWSETYLISKYGYHVKMSVYLNGERTVKGKFASIYIYIVNGSYDHILPWPFSKKLSLVILDGKKCIISERINVIQNYKFSTPLKPSKYHSVLIGYSRLFKLEAEYISKYIRNDVLIIRLIISN